MAMHLTEVGCWSRGTEIGRNGTRVATNQNILTTVGKDIEATGYKALEESKVETKVALLHCLPTHIGIAELALTVDGVRRVAQR